MALQPDTQRIVDALQEAGYDTSPEGHERMSCACGHDGPPAHVLRFDEVKESGDDSQYFVCPGCGDY